VNVYKDLIILCVEDDEIILKAYESLFSIIFKKVYLAKNGKEAVEIFNSKHIDIILTDQMMPEMNGIEMARIIRKKDFDIPIILVTALENLEMLKSAVDINITAFLKKPLKKDLLFSKLNFIANSIIAKRLLFEKQKKYIEYSKYQENLAYKKQTKISKVYEDYDLQNYKLEYLYKPKDILAGDGFLVKNNIIFLIDAMGKGVSASVTSVIATSFVDYLIDKYTNLKSIIVAFLNHMKKFILNDEIISCSFFQFKKNHINYSLFSMPPVLIEKNGSLERLKSNNFAISFYTDGFKINKTTAKKSKILIYSDGLSEAEYNNSLYYKELQKDFMVSKNLNDLLQKIKQKNVNINDDMTILFLKAENG